MTLNINKYITWAAMIRRSQNDFRNYGNESRTHSRSLKKMVIFSKGGDENGYSAENNRTAEQDRLWNSPEENIWVYQVHIHISVADTKRRESRWVPFCIRLSHNFFKPAILSDCNIPTFKRIFVFIKNNHNFGVVPYPNSEAGFGCSSGYIYNWESTAMYPKYRRTFL